MVHGKGIIPLDAPVAVFTPLGLPVALYMRLMWFGRVLFAALSAVALGSIVFNMTGTYLRDGMFGGGAVGWFYYSHTLGNAPKLLWLHSLTACALTVLLCGAIAWEQQRLKQIQQNAMGTKSVTAAHFAVLVSGLPTEAEQTMKALKELCGRREVVQLVVPLENRQLVLAIREHAAARLAHQRAVAFITAAEREAANSRLAAEAVMGDAVTSTADTTCIAAVEASAADLARMQRAAMGRTHARAVRTREALDVAKAKLERAEVCAPRDAMALVDGASQRLSHARAQAAEDWPATGHGFVVFNRMDDAWCAPPPPNAPLTAARRSSFPAQSTHLSFPRSPLQRVRRRLARRARAAAAAGRQGAAAGREGRHLDAQRRLAPCRWQQAVAAPQQRGGRRGRRVAARGGRARAARAARRRGAVGEPRHAAPRAAAAHAPGGGDHAAADCRLDRRHRLRHAARSQHQGVRAALSHPLSRHAGRAPRELAECASRCAQVGGADTTAEASDAEALEQMSTTVWTTARRTARLRPPTPPVNVSPDATHQRSPRGRR